MTQKETDANQYDEWLKDDSNGAALIMRQCLEPVEGKDAVIFPPTYAKPERMKEEDWVGYNIDHFEDGTSVCQIDSVGSQANWMEPIFKRKSYKELVPQIVVKAGDNKVNLLDAGHRAADAIVRFSDLSQAFDKAFLALKNDGNAELLAKLSPTSLVFGAWDSRATQVKLSRIVRSVIRAYDIKILHRSAQYIPAIEYVDEGLVDAPEGKKQQDSMSQLGLSHAPAPWSHGGIQVQGEIRRDATLNLVALRRLGSSSDDTDATLKLRRYILGLSLISFTASQETFLREGCQLVPNIDKEVIWQIVQHNGKRNPISLDHKEVLKYAKVAAREFVVGNDKTPTFNAETAKEALGQSKEERKKSRRSKNKKDEKEEAK